MKFGERMSCSFVRAVGVLFLCAACVVPCAGNAESSPTAPGAGLPTGRKLHARDLLDALRAAGAKVQSEGPVDQPFFTVRAQIFNVDGEGVQVFEYPNAAAADAQAATVSRDGTQVGSSKPFWIGTPHFYKRANLLVLYPGDDDKVLKLLRNVLGEQFAGR